MLFGDGIVLARGFSETGLAVWIGEQLTNLQNLSLFLLVLILVASVNFLTEVTSHLATTAMLLSILAPMGPGNGTSPVFIANKRYTSRILRFYVAGSNAAKRSGFWFRLFKNSRHDKNRTMDEPVFYLFNKYPSVFLFTQHLGF